MTDPNYTHVLLIVDRSGSMQTIQSDMNGAINAFMSDQAKVLGTLKVDVITFDNKPEYAVHNAPAKALVDTDFVQPRGSTALYDAIGMGITEMGSFLSGLSEDARPALVQVVVVTDGEENASTNYTADQVRTLVKTQSEVYSWDFVFLGANIDAFAIGGNLGFSQGSTLNYAASSAGVANSAATLSSRSTKLRSSVAKGESVISAASANNFSEKDRKAAMEGDKKKR